MLEVRAHRPVYMCRKGVVASGHYLASMAGLRMLMEGGNAIDAAIAVAASLSVVEPAASGLGGDGFLLIYLAKEKKLIGVNGTGAAPHLATPEFYRARGGMPSRGILSVSVPGIVDGWLVALETYGTMRRAEVLAPAIEYARDGFPVSHRLSSQTEAGSQILGQYPEAATIFLPQGRSPQPGEVLVQQALAQSLEQVSEGGSEAFYRGPIAREIVRFSQEAGGILSEADLADHHSRWAEPISTTYRDHIVYEFPPNSCGNVLLQELNMVENFDLARLGFGNPEAIHLMVEAKKLAFADRERYIADPDGREIPLEWLLSKEYACQRAALIDRSRAADAVQPGIAPAHTGDTTYFAVVDGEGNAVSQHQSINSFFGSGVVAGNTGILLNNRMTPWHLEAGHVNLLEPGRRVRHTMNPVMVFRGDELRLVYGTPGGDGQVQTNLQVLTNILDFGMNVQEAVEAPRWRSDWGNTASNWPHTTPDELLMEARFPEDVREALTRKGHRVAPIGKWDPTVGSVMAIMVAPESGAKLAAADPRRDGYAVGW